MSKKYEHMDNYKSAFTKLWFFMAKHLRAKTDKDFKNLVEGLSEFETDFEQEMAAVIANEIERRYEIERQYKQAMRGDNA